MKGKENTLKWKGGGTHTNVKGEFRESEGTTKAEGNHIKAEGGLTKTEGEIKGKRERGAERREWGKQIRQERELVETGQPIHRNKENGKEMPRFLSSLLVGSVLLVELRYPTSVVKSGKSQRNNLK